MNFVRKVANSNILASIIDIPESLRNKKVEILILPYENEHGEAGIDQTPKRARGLLEQYKNKGLQALEDGAWAKAAVDKHENS
ncbi:hypothetical protein [Desulfallas thermosapovorans]|uniref:Uncharacterized protein n=1 Tax=Desulfallas thermosapovorans DSM 6562 TaxID=1121431 RepID=A0A5S4ZW10_9FIRM|nr:hypothetical protein [Desulfallas thermosapovorans]TYO96929.1 hypothetical protein LX24_00739 [Desulfallas thermosapovorans DSM 6562]